MPDDGSQGWPNPFTWAISLWLSTHRYTYMIQVALSCWGHAKQSRDRSVDAHRAMSDKLRCDVLANREKIDTAVVARGVAVNLELVDFEAIADHQLAIIPAYVRRLKRS